jgi:rhodanese-related sulfurtransferase
MPTFQNLLKGVKSEIREVDVQTLHARLATPAPPVVLDVREQDEYVQGYIDGAIWIPRGFLELRI